MNVIKRDGKVVPFNIEKIYIAIEKADRATTLKGQEGIKDFKLIKEKIRIYFSERSELENIEVEKIQDTVECFLMEEGAYNTAKNYIEYRFLHKLKRNKYNELMDMVESKLFGKENDKQNANIDESSFGGRMGEASRILNKEVALNHMSEMAKNNHLNNEIYIHDLDSYAAGMHNCMTIPFDDLLKNGFNTRQTDVRPAQSVNTAGQLVAVIFQLQSLQEFGGVSASHIDWTMVPYIRKSFKKHYIEGLKYIEGIFSKELFNHIPDDAGIEDKEYKIYDRVYKYAMDMTIKETYQAVEALFHNLNTLQSRSGNQLPFTSINFGTCTLPEGRLFTKAILDTSIKGIGKLHRTSIFPCTIFQCMKGVNRKEGEPNYDLYLLALKSTSLRLYPNYCNVDWSVNEGYDKNDPRTYVSTMGLEILAHVKSLELRSQVSFLRLMARSSIR